MKDRLRTLNADQKMDSMESLFILIMFILNPIQFFFALLLFRREPGLLVDILLVNDDNESYQVNEWLQKHRQSPLYKWADTGDSRDQSAELQSEFQERNSYPCSIDVLINVLLRNHVQSRNNVQVIQKSDPLS